jgi:alpha-mannosidase
LNQPLLVQTAQVTDGAWQAIATDPALAISALKPAEDGQGLVLRLYEPAGGTVNPDLRLPAGWHQGGAVNLLEKPSAQVGAMGPFAIRSVKLLRD